MNPEELQREIDRHEAARTALKAELYDEETTLRHLYAMQQRMDLPMDTTPPQQPGVPTVDPVDLLQQIANANGYQLLRTVERD